MATFRERFPSRPEVIAVLAACIFPIHVWSIITVLRELPAWILRLNSWDIIGLVAYTQAFALVESLLFLFFLLTLAVFLPMRWFRQQFVPLATTAVFVFTLWAVLIHYSDHILRQWSAGRLLLLLPVFLLTLGMPAYLIRRYPRIEAAVLALSSRLSVLSFLYFTISLVSLFIVVVRQF